MCSPRLSTYLAPLALLALSGCGYVHVGRLPEPTTTNVIGDEKLLQENGDLRAEKKILQQELAITRAQGDALRSAIENRAADGDTSRRLVDRLSETTRELSLLRSNYAQLQAQRAANNPAEIAELKAKLAGAEDKLASSLRNFTQLQEEIGGLRSEVAKTRAENIALSEEVRVISAKNTEVQLALAQLNAELLVQKETRTRVEQDAATLRTQLDSANTRLSALAQQRTGAAPEASGLAPAGVSTDAELRTQLESLQQKVTALEAERATLKQQVASKESNPEDLKKLADAQAQLVSALNGAKMLRDENDLLKSTATTLARSKAELEAEVARANAVTTAQSLRDQLAQAQAQANALSEENAQLKTRLSAGPPPRIPTSAAPVNISPTPIANTPASVTSHPATVTASPAPSTSSSPTSTPRPNGSPVTATFVVATPGTPAAATTRPVNATGGPRYHTVASGDTLSKISAQYYGTPGRWAEILVANRDVLGEENNLVIGRQLKIP